MRSLSLFTAWAAVGFVCSFGLLYALTPFIVTIILIAWIAHRFMPKIGGQRLPEAIGVLGGFGAFWLFVASTVDGDASALLITGVWAAAISVAWYLAAGRKRCGQRVAT